MSKIWGVIQEVALEAIRSYRKQRASQQLRSSENVEMKLHDAGQQAVRGLENCLPITDHVTPAGLDDLSVAMLKKDHFRSMLAIDSNLVPTRSDLCIALLKIACNVACNGYCVEDISAATYSMITTNRLGR